jgi:hypothetical protein
MEQQHSKTTRVWWDGGEVQFIRWTTRSLVFSWRDASDTAMHMPRGALLRLMKKGVIQVEGDMPRWITHPQSETKQLPKPSAKKTQPGLFSAITRLIKKLGSDEPAKTNEATEPDAVPPAAHRTRSASHW